MEAALQVQVDYGELIAVEQSEWAAPIVVASKSNGGIHICGDFKVLVNPVLVPLVYNLPTPEEMFGPSFPGLPFGMINMDTFHVALIKDVPVLLGMWKLLGSTVYTS